MWENAYYGPGSDDGVMQLADGPIGCANGFEWARTRTAARLRGRVRLLAGGMCFPSFPQLGADAAAGSGSATTARCSTSRVSRRAAWRACSGCLRCIPRTSATSSWRRR